jgi:hypothetical protein
LGQNVQLNNFEIMQFSSHWLSSVLAAELCQANTAFSSAIQRVPCNNNLQPVVKR